MSEELIAPSEQGTPVTEYKTFKNLPNPVQVRLQEYNSFVGKTVRRLLVGTSELNFFNTSNPSAELSLAGVLKYVRNHSFLIADGFTETHPGDSYLFLQKLYNYLQNTKNKSKIIESPYYLRFLAEYISSIDLSGNYDTGKDISIELESNIQRHMGLLLGDNLSFDDLDAFEEKISHISISNDQIVMYRNKLLNALSNLGNYYVRIGRNSDYNRITRLAKILAKKFYSAQIFYDLLLLDIKFELSKEVISENIDILFTQATTCFDAIGKVYLEGDSERLEKESLRLKVLNMVYEARKLLLEPKIDVVKISGIIDMRNSLLGGTHLGYEEIPGLIEIEIYIYMAIDRLMTNPEDLSEAILSHPKEMLMVFQRAVNKVNAEGLDINTHLKEDNAGLFVGSLVRLFIYRTESNRDNLSTNVSLRSHLLEKMLIIYDIFIGIETGRQDIFTKQAFYQSYIRACRIILQTFQLAQESDQTILEGIHDALYSQTPESIIGKVIINNILEEGDNVNRIKERSPHVVFGYDSEDTGGMVEKISLEKLDQSFMDKCIAIPGIITFENSMYSMSVISTSILGVGRKCYTFRFGIPTKIRDTYPPFLGIMTIIIDSDGYIHYDEIISKTDDKDICAIFLSQKKLLLEKLGNFSNSDVDTLLEENLIYSDTFGSISRFGNNKKGHSVFIVKTRTQNGGEFRSEINTYTERGVHYIYLGAMCNTLNGHNLNQLLGWLGSILLRTTNPMNAAAILGTEIIFFRDSRHGTDEGRKNQLNVERFLKMMKRAKEHVEDKSENTYSHHFWWKFMHSDDGIYPIRQSWKKLVNSMKNIALRLRAIFSQKET